MDRRTISLVLFISVPLIAVSCLKDAPEEMPSSFTWNPEIAFPVTETALGMNEESGFDTLLLEVNPETGLPYWVELIGIPIEGETGFDFANIIEHSDEVNRIMFRINAYNGFPARVQLQVYFEEADGDLADSMFTGEPMILDPGRINPDGETVTPVYTREDVIFDRDRIDGMSDVVTITFRTVILNADLDSLLIPFYPTYSIDIQLAAMLDLTIVLD